MTFIFHLLGEYLNILMNGVGPYLDTHAEGDGDGDEEQEEGKGSENVCTQPCIVTLPCNIFINNFSESGLLSGSGWIL